MNSAPNGTPTPDISNGAHLLSAGNSMGIRRLVAGGLAFSLAVAACGSNEPAGYERFSDVDAAVAAVDEAYDLSRQGEEGAHETLETATRGLAETARLELGSEVLSLATAALQSDGVEHTHKKIYGEGDQAVTVTATELVDDDTGESIGQRLTVEHDVAYLSKYTDFIGVTVDAEGTVTDVQLPGNQGYILRPADSLTQDDPILEATGIGWSDITPDERDEDYASATIGAVENAEELIAEITPIIEEGIAQDPSEQDRLSSEYFETANEAYEQETEAAIQGVLDDVADGGDPSEALGKAFYDFEHSSRDEAERLLIEQIPTLVDADKFEEADGISDAVDDKDAQTRETAELALAGAVEAKVQDLVDAGKEDEARNLARTYEQSDKGRLEKIAGSISNALKRIWDIVG